MGRIMYGYARVVGCWRSYLYSGFGIDGCGLSPIAVYTVWAVLELYG